MSHGATFDRSARTNPVSDRVPSVVAELTGPDSVVFDPQSTAVTLDVLDTLFANERDQPDRTPRRVEFSDNGCGTVISDNGAVQNTERRHS